MRKQLLTALFVTLVTVAPAAAQDYKPVDVNFGFGWTFPETDLKNDFDAGWNGAFGVTFNINQHVGVQAEYIYTHMDGPSKTISLSATPVAAAVTNGVIESNHHMHVGSFNLVYRGQSQYHAIGGYALGGAGIYHRTVELTSPSVGYTTYCDPYWYVCYPAAVSVDQIIGNRSSNDFGIDFGGGITFGHEAKFYVEARYHYVWGPSVTPPATQLPGSTTPCLNGCNSNASYFPLTFGFRW
jgi:opacity protein-like surface antigen